MNFNHKIMLNFFQYLIEMKLVYVFYFKLYKRLHRLVYLKEYEVSFFAIQNFAVKNILSCTLIRCFCLTSSLLFSVIPLETVDATFRSSILRYQHVFLCPKLFSMQTVVNLSFACNRICRCKHVFLSFIRKYFPCKP